MKNFVLVLFCIMYQTTFSQELNVEKYRKDIRIIDDKFTGEKRLLSPLLEPISFMKVISPKDTLYFISLRTVASTYSTGNGVIILLENGDKITKNVETESKLKNSQWEHSAMDYLSIEEMELLKKYNITDVRIYIHDFSVSNPEKYRAYITLMETMK